MAGIEQEVLDQLTAAEEVGRIYKLELLESN
jgi:hypothetical protein